MNPGPTPAPTTGIANGSLAGMIWSRSGPDAAYCQTRGSAASKTGSNGRPLPCMFDCPASRIRSYPGSSELKSGVGVAAREALAAGDFVSAGLSFAAQAVRSPDATTTAAAAASTTLRAITAGHIVPLTLVLDILV